MSKASEKMSSTTVELIKSHPKFKVLVAQRNRLGIILTVVMLFTYYGFIGLIAFNKELLAQRLGDGVLTVGIPIGFALILLSILLTWHFVRQANGRFDKLRDELLKDIQK